MKPSFPTVASYRSVKEISGDTRRYLLENVHWYPKGIKTHLLLMAPQGMAAAAGVCTVHQPGYKVGVATYEDGYMRWSYDPRDFIAISKAVISAVEAHSDTYKLFIKTFWKQTRMFVAVCDRVQSAILPKDPALLADEFVRFVDGAVVPQSYGYLTEIFTLTDNYWVTEYIAKLAPTLTNEETQVLLVPATKSFTQCYQDELRKASTESDFAEILRRYYFVKGSYFAQPALSIESLKQEKVSLGTRQEGSNSFRLSKQDILRKVGNTTLNRFVSLVEDFIAMQDERKATVLRTNYAIRKFTDTASVVVPEWSEDMFLSLMPQEFVDVLKGMVHQSYQVTVKERNRQSVWLFEENQYCITSEPQLVAFITGVLEEKSVTEIKGYVVSRGVIRGRVAIVLSEQDFKKVAEGDILVTSMTRPEFMPVLQRAAAFVTNEGGITCHAAIVSRELKKPCIIGTKIATKVLKDGDMVEVDAERGVVTILKEKR